MKTIAHKTGKMKQIETKQGIEIEELLRRLYVDENLSSHDIAALLQISYPVVISWLKKAGIYSHRLRI